MKITINTFGTYGDVQPYVALGKGLQKAGHVVRIVTHRIFEDFVNDHGLELIPLEIDPRQVLLSQAVTEFRNNIFHIIRWMEENFRLGLGDIFRATLEAALDADLLLNSSLSFAGWHVAEKLKIPAIASYLWPVTPTRDFPSASVPIPPPWLPLKGIYNYASTKLANQFFFRILLPLTNTCREEILDLPPLSATDYWLVDSPQGTTPIIYGFSPSVIPKPNNWGPYQQIAGYWFLDGSKGYTPPNKLKDFLAAGTPPVCVGFGSMVDHEREEMKHLVIEALEKVQQRAILLGGWSELGATNLPDSILSLEFVPHDWLLPQSVAIVHHGGAGTTHAGLRAGIPNVVVPFFGDQPFWGWRVYNLGAGPKWLPRMKLTAEKLAAAIRQVVNDENIRNHAAQLGKKIRAENGIKTAEEMIKQYVEKNSF